MSAIIDGEGEKTKDGRMRYSFTQSQAIPAYLFAIAVGNLAKKDLGLDCYPFWLCVLGENELCKSLSSLILLGFLNSCADIQFYSLLSNKVSSNYISPVVFFMQFFALRFCLVLKNR